MSGRVILSGWEFWISLSNIWAWSKKSIANNKWRLYTLSNREGEKKISSKDYFVSGRIFTEAPRLLFSWKKPARTSWWEKFRIDQGGSKKYLSSLWIIHEKIFPRFYFFYHLVQILSNEAQKLFLLSKIYTFKLHPIQFTLYVTFSN